MASNGNGPGGDGGAKKPLENGNAAKIEAGPPMDKKEEWLRLRENNPNIDGGWGWMVVFSSFMIHVIADGITYAFGIVIIELTDHFNSGKGETSWVASIMIGICFISGPLASTLTNVYGCRVTTIAGTLLTSLGFILSVFAPNLYFMYFSFGVMGGIGLGLIYLPAIVSVGQYFEKKRSFATGLAVCGSGIGTFAFAPIMQLLVDEYTWKGGTLIVAGLILNCAICGALLRPLEYVQPSSKESGSSIEKKKLLNKEKFLEHLSKKPAPTAVTALRRNDTSFVTSCPEFNEESQIRPKPPRIHFASGPIYEITVPPQYRSLEDMYQEIFNTYKSNHMLHFVSMNHIPTDGDEEEEKETCMSAMKGALAQLSDFSLLSNIVFMVFAFSNFCTSIGFNAPYIYLPDNAQLKGVDKDKASFLIAVIGIGNTFGRVFFGYISDLPRVRKWRGGKLGRLTIYATALTLCGLATILSPWCDTYALMVTYAASYGILVGTYVTLTAVVLVDLIGLENLTSSFGLLLLFQGIATLVGPPIAGWVFDITGSYDYSFYIIGATIAFSGAILFVYFAPCLYNGYLLPNGVNPDEESGSSAESNESNNDGESSTKSNGEIMTMEEIAL